MSGAVTDRAGNRVAGDGGDVPGERPGPLPDWGTPTDDEQMPSRPGNGRLLSLLLLVATMAVLLTGCSLLSTPLCKEGDALVAAAQPDRALEVYARAKAQGDSCADKGLEGASTNQRRAVEEAARGEVAERAGDIPVATAAYQAALVLDVTNALAVAGLARLGQPQPVPPPPVATPPPALSWWAGPWPYFLGSVLISALFAGAVLWLVKQQMVLGLQTRLDTLKDELDKLKNELNKLAVTSHSRLGGMEQRQESNQVQLDGNQAQLTELLRYRSSDQALINRLNEDTDALTQATRWELRLQKERIDHLTELIDMSAQTQAEPTSEVVVSLEPPSVAGTPADEVASDKAATGTEGGASADAAIGAGDMRVEVNVFAIGISHGQAGQEQLVIQRVIERVMERDEAEKLVSSNPHCYKVPLSEYKVPLREQEPGPLEKAAADSIVDSVWIRIESWWVTPDYQGLADGAKWVKGVKDGWHDLVLGTPAESIALGAGFSPASADVMEAIAEKISLPGDSLFKSVRRLLQYTGIVLGAVSGTAPFANACVSSLAHDLLAEATARAFREVIIRVLAPVRRLERPIPATELGPDGAPAQQLHNSLNAAATRQREHELEIRDKAVRTQIESILYKHGLIPETKVFAYKPRETAVGIEVGVAMGSWVVGDEPVSKSVVDAVVASSAGAGAVLFSGEELDTANLKGMDISNLSGVIILGGGESSHISNSGVPYVPPGLDSPSPVRGLSP